MTVGPCIEHRGGRTSEGYGSITFDGKTGLAHRAAWMAVFGPIPDGKQIDHLCRNRGCVNPFHLEPVTRKENILRGMSFSAVNARKTHCIHGHEFTPENTYYERRGRECRTCKRARSRRGNADKCRRYRQRKAAA